MVSNTTIVEIDPAVYDAARIWFGLPDPGPENVSLKMLANLWNEGVERSGLALRKFV